MLFNSIDFAIFLPIVFALYWLVTAKNLRAQNLLVVAASYVFYGWWDWRFLSLIIFSTILDYTIGVRFSKTEKPNARKFLIWISILVNLTFLGFFKYFNFFLDSFVTAFSFFGAQIHASSLHIVLPVGLSFYTFQSLSYTIDVYKRKLEPTHDFITYAAFVSFFPQLVAGPIGRATELLPQFYTPRSFDYNKAVDGMRQMLWGFFKKIVIADNCAEYANQIFNNSDQYSGSTLAVGAIMFAFQIYCDFSGYSDIAIGTSRLFGIDLMRNFAFPYFSRDIAEFWRRWHISLSTWFRDYVYFPLGGSQGSSWMKVRNILITFIISGFWHGANWTFIAWGALNAIYFLPLLLANKNRNHLDVVGKGKVFPSLREAASMLFTFCITTVAWIFFRAKNISHALSYLAGIFSEALFKAPDVMPKDKIILLLVLFFVIEWLGREEQYAIATLGVRWKRPMRYAMYYALLVITVYYSGRAEEFIYFQF
jgi:D-alanyl-lipoteichoic acid acyltransferase DltB (MBOAT superfamily)